jgi:hypothetical protein
VAGDVQQAGLLPLLWVLYDLLGAAMAELSGIIGREQGLKGLLFDLVEATT